MALVWAGWCVAVVAAPPEGTVDARVVAAEAARTATIERVAPAAVTILIPAGSGGGSGVVISPGGLALTNFHVTAGRDWVLCGLPGGRMVPAVLVGIDPTGDLALIQLIAKDPFPFIPLGDSQRLSLGEPVLALGNPFMLAADFEPTASLGIVSGLNRYQYPSKTLLEYTDAIQTDAAINPGNSGGPLVNRQGELVGINGRASFDTRGRVNVGLAYAISIQQVKNFLDHLAGGLIADHASLGATLSAQPGRGVVVADIAETADAYRLGLRTGDEVVSFAHRSIASANQFKGLLGTMPKGWRVPLTYRREETETTIRPRLEGVHPARELESLIRPRTGKAGGKAGARPPIPAPVQPFLEKKTGYANYHFQRKARDRWIGVLRQTCSFTDRRGRWQLRLREDGGAAVEIALTSAAASWSAGADTFAFQTNVDPLGPADDRPVVGGLVALAAWRRLLSQFEQGFPVCAYAGGFPDHQGTLRPTLETRSADGVRIWWHLDRATALPQVIECQLFPDSEPWEWSLRDYRPFEGRPFPHRWELWRGTRLVGTYTLESAELAP